jgi:hypothetical protein
MYFFLKRPNILNVAVILNRINILFALWPFRAMLAAGMIGSEQALAPCRHPSEKGLAAKSRKK